MLWDYIFVGGGLSASVISHRLHSLDQSLNILVIEAGANANNDTTIVWNNSTNTIGGKYDWQYQTVPQTNLASRNVSLNCGKALGGGTVINSAAWIRGDKFDFDLWAETVGDDRWGYEGLLPYMKATEDAPVNDPSENGDDGPMIIQSITSTDREFPLRDQVLSSWKALGLEEVPDLNGNAGSPVGIANLFENRDLGRREIASVVYPLDQITVLTETIVAKVLISKCKTTLQAYGVELANGTQIRGKDIILSAGAIRTPQLLMLSGIGPAAELAKHNIDLLLNAPDVGQNLVDHGLFPAQWKLKDPSAGYALGSSNPLFEEPQYGWGTPVDFLVTYGVRDKEGLAKAIEADEGVAPDPAIHPLLRHNRTFNEHVFEYTGSSDGSTITFVMINLLPTSRGNVSLASANINDVPLINPNYHATEVDKFVARDGLRLEIDFAGSNLTVIGSEILDGELGAAGFDEVFTVDSTDEYIDERVAAALGSTYHPMGTAAMGKVVDNDLCVKGVNNLRVADSSVYPVVIAAHLQVATYALALQAADIIYQDRANSKKINL